MQNPVSQLLYLPAVSKQAPQYFKVLKLCHYSGNIVPNIASSVPHNPHRPKQQHIPTRVFNDKGFLKVSPWILKGFSQFQAENVSQDPCGIPSSQKPLLSTPMTLAVKVYSQEAYKSCCTWGSPLSCLGLLCCQVYITVAVKCRHSNMRYLPL